ncbi:uncharacterized protein P884DRAFT_293169 [Thermothelomyces heterothallicus CBS 202.75]|uniref:uncharacterized protein n=1 Tax=Thermothelomyces heterothallicus CBS 202.75 TaxID=1149848 RepID=UPI0037447025
MVLASGCPALAVPDPGLARRLVYPTILRSATYCGKLGDEIRFGATYRNGRLPMNAPLCEAPGAGSGEAVCIPSTSGEGKRRPSRLPPARWFGLPNRMSPAHVATLDFRFVARKGTAKLSMPTLKMLTDTGHQAGRSFGLLYATAVEDTAVAGPQSTTRLCYSVA